MNNMRNNKILPGHHGHEQIDEWFAQRAVSRAVEGIVLAVIAFGCLIGAYYTAGPVDKTAPFLFYVIREMFGENTCIVFFVAAIVFALLSRLSGSRNSYDRFDNTPNGNH